MKQRNKEKLLLRLIILLVLTSVTTFQAMSQNVEQNVTPEISAQVKQNLVKKTWQLRISKGATPLIDLSASEASLAEVASDLSGLLGVPVNLSPVMQKQRVTSKLEEASLEVTARSLAPMAYLDEAIDFPLNNNRQLLGIFLSGLNEAPQPSSNRLNASNQTDMIFGNTEGGTSESSHKENPLCVKAENGRISIRATRQSVTIILFEIAQQLGIPFELQQEAGRLIDIDLQDHRLEDVLRELPVNVRLLRQLNLSSGESQPYRIILLASQD